MYRTKTTFTISAAHKLNLDYESPCSSLHGHNWRITVYCKSDELDKNGMVIDFRLIKRLVSDKLDHHVINDIMARGINPTAENMAKWVWDVLGGKCYRVEVQETEGNVATYEPY